RACASRVTLAAGQVAGERAGAIGETMVLYMAGRRGAAALAELAADGWPAATPAAWVAPGTTPAPRIRVGPVPELRAPRAGAGPDEGAPALLIVGDVVARRAAPATLRPLAGHRVVVARARPGRSRIARALRAAGAEVIETPRIDVEPLSGAPIEAALGRAAAI